MQGIVSDIDVCIFNNICDNVLLNCVAMGFKVGNANFDMQLQSCPEDQKVLVILVKEAKDVYLDDEKSVTDPFCRIDLLEPVNDFDQLQRTSRMLDFAFNVLFMIRFVHRNMRNIKPCVESSGAISFYCQQGLQDYLHHVRDFVSMSAVLSGTEIHNVCYVG